MRTATVELNQTTGRPNRARAFTLVELLMSLLVIGVLMGLLIVGLRQASRSARGSAEAQNVASMKMAVAQFASQFGFVPPMVRDQYTVPNLRLRTEKMTGRESDRLKLAVYDVGDPTNGDTFRKFLQRDPAPAPPANWGSRDPNLRLDRWFDPRYSETTLAAYLVGAVSDEVGPPVAGRRYPVDLVPGPGFMQPNLDGSFGTRRLRDSLLTNAADQRRRTSRVFQAFFAAGTRAASLYADPSNGNNVQIRDRNGRPFRYYSWLPDDVRPTGVPQADLNYQWLNVPWILGDSNERTDLRDAEFAILGAGPNGAFGDEPIDELSRLTGISVGAASSAGEQLKARQAAAADNVLEVGKSR